MPYLHYESDLYRSRMSRAINRTQVLNPMNQEADAPESFPSSPDDMLIKAYLNVHSSNAQPGLHPRRTLDQFFYHGIDTSVRDQDQVVYRYCKEQQIELKVFMVDQLWMWILGKGMYLIDWSHLTLLRLDCDMLSPTMASATQRSTQRPEGHH
jgi:hypothetical protein